MLAIAALVDECGFQPGQNATKRDEKYVDVDDVDGNYSSYLHDNFLMF